MAQQNFIQPSDARRAGPVECLGMTFASDEERRAYFTEQLREKLRDPEFRTIEGFPIGSDEDILALSDPPYYTACPNPFIEEFVRAYGRPYDPNEPYSKEPFAADVSEGKNDPIYNAHSYHTKVPHKAIMRYILHYTKPGDIVLDGFCGTGMTGIAAQLCTSPDPEFKAKVEQEWVDASRGRPEWGARRVILGELSPAATFIAQNYNLPLPQESFLSTAREAVAILRERCEWMYTTKDSKTEIKCPITHIIWSEVFECPSCGRELVYWDLAVDYESMSVQDTITCPYCGTSRLSKPSLAKIQERYTDNTRREQRSRVKRVPVKIEYIFNGKRLSKKPDANDISLIQEIESIVPKNFFPDIRIDKDIDLWYERDYRSLGVDSVRDFFFNRCILTLSEFRAIAEKIQDSRIRTALLWVMTSVVEGSSLMNRERPGGLPSKLSGTLYIGALIREINPISFIERKIEKLASLQLPRMTDSIVTTQSSTALVNIPSNSVDYIFIDPPFGSNFIYSDLNILWESWLKVFTETKHEAVIHRRKKEHAHQLSDYLSLMSKCLLEMFRLLKPGRWMTVEFSNTKASVWNALQVAIEQAGFVVAGVTALDKQQHSFKAVTTPTAVKQDLVISCYKPASDLEERFEHEQGGEVGAWEFIRMHLGYLPVFLSKGVQAVEVVERTPRILYDRLVAYFVQHGYAVPLSAQEFQAGLGRRFPVRDGMYFLPEQIDEYERKRRTVREVQQLQIFVSGEDTAIQWVRQQLLNKPQMVSDLTPSFLRELNAWPKHEVLPELRSLLDENFLVYDGSGPIPAQIVAWMRKSTDLRDLIANELASGAASEDNGALTTKHPRLVSAARDRWYVPDPNKAIDLEKVRLRGLLKEFAAYRDGRGKLKQFRTEAVKAGFAQAWKDRDYPTIVRVAERLPESVLQEDPDLLMYYDNASLRAG